MFTVRFMVELGKKTARSLQQNYPTTSHENVIIKVEAFLRHVLEKKDSKRELEISEAEHYAIRQAMHAVGRLTTLSPLIWRKLQLTSVLMLII